MGRGTIFVSKGFYPKSFIKHVMARGHITGCDITYAIFADRYLKADVFKKWVTELYQQYPEDSKALINFTIGCFGALYSRKTKAGVTSDFDTAMATIADTPNGLLYEITDVNVADETKRLFIIQHNEERMKDFGDMPIYRQVIASSLIQLDKMVEALDVAPEHIVGYNTDAIKIKGSFKQEATKDKQECVIGDYHVEDARLLTGRSIAEQDRFQDYKYEPVRMTVVDEDRVDLKRILQDGAVITGGGGVGKTEFIRTICKALTKEQRKKTVVLSYTNAAVENVRGRLKAFTLTKETVSGFLWNGSSLSTDALEEYDYVILDEFCMLPPTEMGMLLNAQKRFGTTIICLGDPEQCKAPVDNWVD
jgi:AAA domain